MRSSSKAASAERVAPSSQSFRTDKNFVKLKGPALGRGSRFIRAEKPKSGLGHVGFYMGRDKKRRFSLSAANESDAVRQQFESKVKLVGYFWPKIHSPTRPGAPSR